MKKLTKNLSKKAGHPPGTPVFVGDKKVDKVVITVIDYNENTCETREIDSVEDCFPFKETPTVTWMKAEGLIAQLPIFYNFI